MELAFGGEAGAAVDLHDLGDVGGVLDLLERDLVNALRVGRTVDIEQLRLVDAVFRGLIVDGVADGVLAVLSDVGAEPLARLCAESSRLYVVEDLARVGLETRWQDAEIRFDVLHDSCLIRFLITRLDVADGQDLEA